MSPRSDDSSLPIHIGQTIIDGVMDLKAEVGKLSGQISGLQTSLGDLHGRIAQCMTRDECAAIHSGKRRNPSIETRKRDGDWLDRTQKKIAIITGLFVILGVLGAAFYWMSNAYAVIEKARQEIKAVNDSGVKR